MNLKAFLKKLPKKIPGQEVFLAIASHLSEGKIDLQINIADIKNNWKKSIIGTKFNYNFYERCQQKNWVKPLIKKPGLFSITEEGREYFSQLFSNDIDSHELKQAGQLIIFNTGSTHTFDKFLRKIVSKAHQTINIADSYVDGTIFDNILDQAKKTVKVKFIYAHDKGSFLEKGKRFSKEYKKFNSKRHGGLHDRFIIVDGKGYILGPSIKDAAANGPALIVELSKKESDLLLNFFNDLYKA